MVELLLIGSLFCSFGAGVLATLSVQAMPRKRKRRSTWR